jgi:hypothetical protein
LKTKQPKNKAASNILLITAHRLPYIPLKFAKWRLGGERELPGIKVEKLLEPKKRDELKRQATGLLP